MGWSARQRLAVYLATLPLVAGCAGPRPGTGTLAMVDVRGNEDSPRLTAIVEEIPVLVPTASNADGGSMPTVASTRAALMQGIRLQVGKSYSARLVGENADFLRAKLQAKTEVIVGARPLANLVQPGCRRMELSFRFPGFMVRRTQTAPPEPFAMYYGLNLCPDGMPPGSAALAADEPTTASPEGPR